MVTKKGFVSQRAFHAVTGTTNRKAQFLLVPRIEYHHRARFLDLFTYGGIEVHEVDVTGLQNRLPR